MDTEARADWAGFVDRLVDAFRVLSERVSVIVSWQENPRLYVQFAAGADVLYAEATGPAFVSGFDPTPLVTSAWVRPDLSRPNWSFALPLPALAAEYARLAERYVVTLRDVFGVESPDALQYRAWRDPERFPEGVTLSPSQLSALDAGEVPLAIPELGLPLRD